MPYDETRVVLKNYLNTDYINANHIRPPIESIGREYIATQGPLTATINDFWYMVQQETVKCIVMITRETEGMKVFYPSGDRFHPLRSLNKTLLNFKFFFLFNRTNVHDIGLN